MPILDHNIGFDQKFTLLPICNKFYYFTWATNSVSFIPRIASTTVASHIIGASCICMTTILSITFVYIWWKKDRLWRIYIYMFINTYYLNFIEHMIKWIQIFRYSKYVRIFLDDVIMCQIIFLTFLFQHLWNVTPNNRYFLDNFNLYIVYSRLFKFSDHLILLIIRPRMDWNLDDPE